MGDSIGNWLQSLLRSLCSGTGDCVQCAIKPPSNDPSNVHLEVKSKLENELRKKNITLEECNNINPPYMLVFCVVSSRIGIDVENALQGVSKGVSMMLVVLHYTIPNQIVGDLADSEDLLEDAFHCQLRKEKRITHFAFHERHGGLYDHEQNNFGMKKLVEFFEP